MSNVPSREMFESMYAGKAPWDIGRPQKPFLDVADRVTGRTEGVVLGDPPGGLIEQPESRPFVP
jgi:hypothetical protein